MAATSRDAATAAITTQPDTHPFTCNSCQVAFRNGDLQKGHMRGEWHRYNLKRRVASLPPISSDVFAEKVLQARATTDAAAEKTNFERVCEICQRTYYSENSYQNHISSQKHKLKEAVWVNPRAGGQDDEAQSVITSSTFSLGEPQAADAGSVDSDAEEEFTQLAAGLKKTTIHNRPSPVKRPSNPHLSSAGQRKAEHPISQTTSGSQSTSATPTPSKSAAPAPSTKSCLFCNYSSPTIALNAAHMERFHGMFIPEKQYLVDLEGLLGTLERKVREDFECIECGKLKGDVFAIQTHMRDKSHCKIPYISERDQLEIGDFYDFRSTYSDEESEDESADDDKQNGGAKLGAKRATKLTNEAGGEAGEDEAWETDSSASSLDSDDIAPVYGDLHDHQYERLDKHPHHVHTDPRSHHQKDGWHSHAHKPIHTAFYDEYELHLPGGKSVGHRQHNKYYRQNLRHHPSPAEREEKRQLAIENGDADEEHSDNAHANRALTHAPRQPGRDIRGLSNVSDRVRTNLTHQSQRSLRQRDLALERNVIKRSSNRVGQNFFKVVEGR